MKNFSPNANFQYYMYWINERMNIFWNRFEGKPAPYTNDEILKQHKFTNVYRALDRASQYLLTHVIYNGNEYTAEEMFWRILIYKHFNLPSTWDLLIEEFGDIDSRVSLGQISDYLVKKIDEGHTLYSNAYMMTSAFLSGNTGKYCHLKANKWRKHQYYFYIFERELIEGGKVSEIMAAKTMEEAFNIMSSVTSFGGFTTYQYIQDINYTNFVDWDDNSFCAAGPGTIRGIERCFNITGKADYQEIVKWVQNNFESLCDAYGIKFHSIANHMPTVPDLSNCFCETDKYLRGAGVETEGKKVAGKRIKQVFKENNKKINYVFPDKWLVGEMK